MNRTLKDLLNIFPCKVVRVIDDYELVINRGSTHGIKKRQRFLVYAIDPEEVVDIDTGNTLGHLEIVKGTGVAIHVQENITTIQSDMFAASQRKIIKKKSPLFQAFGGAEEEEIVPSRELKPFIEPAVGDKVKPV